MSRQIDWLVPRSLRMKSSNCSWMKYQGCLSKRRYIRLRSFNLQIYFELHRGVLLLYCYLLFSIIPLLSISSIILHCNTSFPSMTILSLQYIIFRLTLSWRRSLSYRNQSIYLQSKSINWFLYIGNPVMKQLKTSQVVLKWN